MPGLLDSKGTSRGSFLDGFVARRRFVAEPTGGFVVNIMESGLVRSCSSMVAALIFDRAAAATARWGQEVPSVLNDLRTYLATVKVVVPSTSYS